MALATQIPLITLSLLSDPAVDGTLYVSDTSLLELGAQCYVTATGQPTKTGKIVVINTANSFKLGRLTDGGPLDISAYTVSAGAAVQQASQAVATTKAGDPELAHTVATAGLTVNSNGQIKEVGWKATIDKSAWVAAALTQDLSICTIPAKAKVVRVVTDTTAAFAGLAGTITLSIGKTAGGAQYIVAHDVKTGVITKGNADVDMGAALIRATATIDGGDVPSWSADTVLSARLTSGTGNIGDGTVTNLSAGTVTIYIIAKLLP